MLHKISARRKLQAENWNLEPPDVSGDAEIYASGVVLVKDDLDGSEWQEVWGEARQDEGICFMPCPSAPRSWGIDLFDIAAISTDGVNFLTKQEVASFSNEDEEEDGICPDTDRDVRNSHDGTQKISSAKTIKNRLLSSSQQSMTPSMSMVGKSGQQLDTANENFDLRKFYIKTTPIGFHRGKTFAIVCPSEDTKDQWLEGLTETLTEACHKWPNGLEVSSFELFRSNLRIAYASRTTQTVTALFIVLNFAFEITASQRHTPNPDPYEDWVSGIVEAVFTGIFTLELLANMVAHMWTLFIIDPWNWFDVLVMSVSLASLVELSGGQSIPGITVLRLLRGLRIVRLFNRLKSLRNIIQALYKSIPAMLNAFSIVCVIMSIYAIMAVDFFSDVSPDPIEGVTDSYNATEYFGNWSASMFTLFQILTGDGWTDIVRPLFYLKEIPTNGVGFFFVSYIIVVSMILVQVVIALLLNEFDNIKASDPTDILREQAVSRLTPHRSRSPFNPLYKEILKFSDVDDLMFRIRRSFSRISFTSMDGATKSRLNFEAFRRGLLRLNVFPAVRITFQDWEKFVVKPGFASEADGKIGYNEFLDLVLKGMHELQVGHVAHASSKVGGLSRDQVDEVLRSLKFLMAKEHITSAIAAAAKPLSPSNPSPLHSIVPLQPERKYLDQVLEPASINGSAWDSKAGGEGPLPHPDPVVEENAEGANAGGRVSLDTAPVMLSGAAGQQQADSNQIHSNHHNPETPRLPPPDEDDVSGDGRPFVVPRAESIDRPSTPSRPMNEESIGLVASRLAGKLDDAMGLIEFLVNEVKSVRGTVEGIDERLGVLEGSVDSIGSRIRMQRLAATAVTGSGSEAARQQQPVAAANANGEWWADLKGLGDRLSQVGNLRGGLEKSPESRQGKRDSEERSVSVQADGSEDGSSAMGLLSPLEPVTSLSARKTRLAKDW